MSEPLLALGISAAGTKTVTDLAAAVNSLKTNLRDLAATAGSNQFQQLDSLTKEFRDMRQDLAQIMQGIRTDLAANMNKAFEGAARAAKTGGDQVDAEVKKAVAKIRVSAKSTDVGSGMTVSVSGSGLESKEAVAKTVSQIRSGADALAAEYERAIVMLDKKVENVMRAATQGPNTMRGDGYIKFWSKVIDEHEAGLAKVAAEYDKSIVTLEKQVSDVMKAATQGPNTLRGTGYIKWWDQVIEQQELAQARLDAEYAKSIVSLDKQVAAVMKAATQAPSGRDYVRWWDQAIAEQEAGLAKMRAEATAMDQEVRKFRAAQDAAFSSSVKGSVGQAMSSGGVVGPFSSISSGSYGALRNEVKDVVPGVEAAGKAASQFKAELRDAEGAARGLASGLGQSLPMFATFATFAAGAAVTGSVVAMVKLGSEVQHTMETIRVLSEESTQSVAGLNAQMMEMARSGPVGPLAIAEAMKTLSLAGLRASEVSSAIKDVINFSIAGTTDIKTAADVLTTVGVAFKISADNYNYVGDVIAKSAAVSKSSVEGMAQAFKTASVLNSQYGVSLEDVGTGLAVLANVGIQGTSAGTALRNMYVDLLGRSPKVQAALKQLGVDIRDLTTGKVIPFVDALKQLDKGLSQIQPGDQIKALQAVFSERGGKAGVEALDLLRTKAKEAGTTVGSLLEEIRKQVEDAAGFMAVSAAQLALTPMNEMKSVVSALQATLVESFNAMQPQVVDISEKLKAAFASEEFKTALQNLGVLVASVTTFLVEHANVLVLVAAGYAGMKVVGVVSAMYEIMAARVVAMISLLTGEAVATEAVTVSKAAAAAATVGATVAEEAAAVATTTLTTSVAGLAAFLGGLLPIIGAAVVAWQLYSIWSGKANDKNNDHVSQNAALITSLNAEADRLKEINDAKAMNISLDELKARKDAQRVTLNGKSAVEAAQADVDSIRNQILSQQPRDSLASHYGGLGSLTKGNTDKLRQQLDVAEQKLAAEQAKADSEAQQVAAAEARVKSEAERMKASVKAEVAGQTSPSGTKAFDIPKNKGGVGTDNTMSTLASQLQSRESALKTAYDRESQLLDLKHRGELVSEGEYQAKVMQMTEVFEAQQRGLVVGEIADLKAAKAAREQAINANPNLKPDARAQALGNLDNEYKKLVESANSTLNKLDSDALFRQQKAIISLDSETKKITKDNDEYWVKAEAGSKKESDLAAARAKTTGMTEEARAALEASIKVEDQHSVHMSDLTRDYLKAAQALQDFTDAQANSDSTSEAAVTQYVGLQNHVIALATAIEASQQKINALKDTAATDAVKEVQTKRADDLYKTLSDKLASAIVDGGQGGFKSLRDWAQDYFLKQPLKIAIQATLQSLLGGANLGGSGGGSILGAIGNSLASFLGSGASPSNFGGATSALSSFGGFSGSSSSLTGGFGGFGSVGTPFSGGAFGSAASSLSGGSSGFGSVLGSLGSLGSLVSSGSSLFGGSSALGGLGSFFGGGGGAAAGAAGAGAGASAGIGAAMASNPIGWMAAAAALVALDVGAGQKTGLTKSKLGSIALTASLPGVATTTLALQKLGIIQAPGGPKGESGFGLGVTQRGDPTMAKSNVKSIEQQFKDLGIRGLGNLDLGMFTATDPQGTAKTQLEVQAAINGQQFYNREDRFGGHNGIENVGRSDEDLQKAITEETDRVLLGGIKASNLGGSIKDYFDALGDLNKINADDLQATLDRAKKIAAEKQTLDDTEFELTHTAAQTLARQRGQELDTLDDLNKAQQNRIYALQDEKAAADSLAQQLDAAKQSASSFADFLLSNNVNIRAYIDRLNTTGAGNGSPTTRLASAQTAFNQQYQLAKAGNQDALGTITQYADTYIAAQKDYSASGGDTSNVIDSIKSMLLSLPAMESSEQFLARTITDSTNSQTATLNAALALINSNAANTAAQVANNTSMNWAGLWGSAGLLASKFDTLDTNVNGLLDFNELSVALSPLADDNTIRLLMAQADTNHDGEISQEEAVRLGVINSTAQQTGYLLAAGAAATQAASPVLAAIGAIGQAVFSNSPVPGTAYFGDPGTSAGNPLSPNQFADGGDHAGGWRIVGERGWELEQTGPSHIYNQDQLAALVGGGSGGSQQEMAALRADVNRLIAVAANGFSRSVAAQERTAGHAKRLADKAAFEKTKV